MSEQIGKFFVKVFVERLLLNDVSFVSYKNYIVFLVYKIGDKLQAKNDII